MTKFKNGDVVKYTGEQKSLKDLKGVVKRDTVAANGNILVLFDGRDKSTVVNPKNLTLVTLKDDEAKAKAKLVQGTNGKDVAVILYGHAREARLQCERNYKAACKGLSDLGLIDTTHERDPGKEVVYESNAVRLIADTVAPGTIITSESITEAMTQAGYSLAQIRHILVTAPRNKKAATTYRVEIK